MDTVLGLTNGFDVSCTSKSLFQILYTNSKHWICVSNQFGKSMTACQMAQLQILFLNNWHYKIR